MTTYSSYWQNGASVLRATTILNPQHLTCHRAQRCVVCVVFVLVLECLCFWTRVCFIHIDSGSRHVLIRQATIISTVPISWAWKPKAQKSPRTKRAQVFIYVPHAFACVCISAVAGPTLTCACSGAGLMGVVGVGIGVAFALVACAGCYYCLRCHTRAKSAFVLLFRGAGRSRKRDKEYWKSGGGHGDGWLRAHAFDFHTAPQRINSSNGKKDADLASKGVHLQIRNPKETTKLEFAQHPRRSAQLASPSAVSDTSGALRALDISFGAGGQHAGHSPNQSSVCACAVPPNLASTLYQAGRVRSGSHA